MKRYTPTRFIPVFALGSALLTGGVMALAVYLPAQGAASAATDAPRRFEVAIEPARIEVVGERRATRAHLDEASMPAA